MPIDHLDTRVRAGTRAEMGEGFLKRFERGGTRVDLRSADVVVRSSNPAGSVTQTAISSMLRENNGTSDDDSIPWWLQNRTANSAQVDALVPAARLHLNELQSVNPATNERELAALVRRAVGTAAQELSSELRFSSKDIQDAIVELQRFLTGKGPLQSLYEDELVTDILLETHDRVRCIRKGKVFDTPFRFRTPAEYEGYLSSMLQSAELILNAARPVGVCVLDDEWGSRIHAVHSSLTGGKENSAVIRIPRLRQPSLFDLLSRGTLPATVAAWLTEVVSASEATIVISGPPKSGKTTLLSVLIGAIGSDERVVAVEPLPELTASGVPFERLLTADRDPNIALEAALRRSPGRIVLGDVDELGGGLAIARVFGSMSRGGLASITAASPLDAFWKLSDCKTGQQNGGFLERRVQEAVHLIVGMGEIDGTPCLTSICEVVRTEDDTIAVAELLRFEDVADRRRRWRLVNTNTPLIDLLLERGIEFQMGPVVLPPLDEVGDGAQDA